MAKAAAQANAKAFSLSFIVILLWWLSPPLH
jgi:hypothetical protein